MNPDVVAMLDLWLGAARRGEVDHVTVVACRRDHEPAAGVAGHVYLEPAAAMFTREVAANLNSRASNRKPWRVDRKLDASHVCFNCALAPMNYDFLTWLIDAEMTRVREGAPAPLKVGFFFGRDGNEGLHTPERKLMFENVMRPALKLLGAVEDKAAERGRCKEFYALRDIVEAARRGERVPRFEIEPVAPEDGRFPVVITLREAEHWPDRNSNLPQWLKFADWLTGRGEKVVFVRDTAKAYELIRDGVTINGMAAVDLHHRMRLYRRAKANFFVSNGPAMLAIFGKRPWACFIVLDEAGAYWPNRPSFWEKNMGIKGGEQFPWCDQRQRIVWKPDTFENMVEAWEALEL